MYETIHQNLHRQYGNAIHHHTHLTTGGSCFAIPIVMLILALVNHVCFSFPIYNTRCLEDVNQSAFFQHCMNLGENSPGLLVYLSISSFHFSKKPLQQIKIKQLITHVSNRLRNFGVT